MWVSSPFCLSVLFILQVSGTLQNTGHTVKFLLDDPFVRPLNMQGGPMSYAYRASEMVLHFGSVDSVGSEHTIDGRAFPAEVLQAQ